MEKFRQFTDEKTGVNPFMPLWINFRERNLKLRRLLSFPLNILGGWFVIFGLGYPVVLTQPADYKRLHMNPFKSKARVLCSLNKTPLIISNFTSPIDVLLYIVYLNPIFALPSIDGKISLLSFWDCLLFSMDFLTIPKGTFTSINEALAHVKGQKGGSVVFFPEGQKSNGTCILHWMIPSSSLEAVADVAQKGSASIVIFKHHNDNGRNHVCFSAPYTTPMSPFKYFIYMSSQYINSVEVSFIPSDELSRSLANVKNSTEVHQKIIDIMCKILGRASYVHSTATDLERFASYWRAH